MKILKLAWRSLWRNPRRTLITLASVALGLAFTIFFSSFVTGIHRKTVADVTRMLAGHVTVEHARFRDDPSASLLVPSVAAVREAAAHQPQVELVKPIVTGEAVLSTAKGSAGIVFMGVDPDVERFSSLLAGKVVKGRYLAASDERGLLLGKRLAARLKANLDSRVVLTTVNAHGETGDTLLHVVGIFDTGSEELDIRLVQVPITVGRRIFGLGEDQATQVGLVLSDPHAQDAVMASMSRELASPDVVFLPWQALMPQLANWMAMTSIVHDVFGGLMFVLVSATILNTILMSVIERRREFAVLLALGTPPRLLRAQVMVESMLVGLLGSALGAAGGSMVALLGRRGIDLSWAAGGGMSIGGIALDLRVRTFIDGHQLAFLTSTVFILTVIAGTYPVLRSTRFDLANALRSR